MHFFYSIADIGVCGETPYVLTLQEESVPFLVQNSDEKHCNVEVVFNRLPNMKPYPGKGIKKMGRLYSRNVGSNVVCYYPAEGNIPYACVHHSEGRLIIDYADESITDMNYSHNLIDLISLETLLLGYHGIIVHSSFIRWNNCGIIFAAPSGTGKSTQAELWTRYEKAECLNGDRTGLRKINGKWTAYGLPYAGTSGIYKNESAPLSAVVVLRQSKDNRILKLKPSEAFKAIYPETMIHQWDADFVSTAADYISELIRDVPVYLLSCRPDRGAVDTLREELTKEGKAE